MTFMKISCIRLLLLGGIFVAGSTTEAQFKNGNQTIILELPRESQRAVTSQRIGLTEITITYHRPQVKGREIWGKLIPYGKVWRAGANEITKIEFTDPVEIEGKPLAPGSYGLHMIPGPDLWTVIFSNDSTSWGSFTYTEKDDALRIAVKPRSNEIQEMLTYDFEHVTPDSAIVSMKWEKIAIPFKISVDARQIALASIRRQLHGLAQYDPGAWDDAARYMLDNGLPLEEALSYVDRSIQMQEGFLNVLTKSEILAALKRTDEAIKLREQAVAKADPMQVHAYARQLQTIASHPKQAFELYQLNAKAHPDSWLVHAGMARVFSAKADFQNAVREMRTAMRDAPEPQKANMQKQILQLEQQQDINR